jgi:4-hydroxy-3-methylbut-2-en-1-yl diphosphate reductase
MNGMIYLAEPRGFCAGVRRALETVEKALEHFPRPIYVYHEIVHNDFVVSELKKRGVVFVEEVAAVPADSVLILSAHGASAKVEEDAAKGQLRLIDATCPLVKRIHAKAEQFYRDNADIYLIGHRGHPEVVGTMGRIENQATVIENAAEAAALPKTECPRKCVCLTQTTLSVEDTTEIISAMRKLIPQLETVEGICYATKNRQDAVRKLGEKCSDIIVIGSKNSSNSNRLRETAEKCGVNAILVNSAAELPSELLNSSSNIGITAGASAPEYLVDELVKTLKKHGRNFAGAIVAEKEHLNFRLPPFPEF